MTYDGGSANRTIGSPGSILPVHSPEDGLHVEKPIGMNLSAMSADGTLHTLFLPYPAKGRYAFEGEIPVSLSPAGDHAWKAAALGRARMSNLSGNICTSVLLENQRMYPLQDTQSEYMLYGEEVNEQSNAFHNYVTLSSAMISIGRLEDNDICYPMDMVSRHHAVLIYEDRTWRISDNDSANGVYVNGKRIDEAELRVGDVIYIMGLRLIIGSGFLAINDGNMRARIRPDKLRRISDTGSVLTLVTPDPDRKAEDLFNRLPRRRFAMEETSIRVESPPASMDGDKMPMMMRMGGSMVMSGSAALTGNVAMLASSLLLPVLSQRYTKEERAEFEKRRIRMYRAYLEQKQEEIFREKEKEEHALRGNYPPLEEVLTFAQEKEKLWERSKGDDDFLLVRLGGGSVPLKARIEYEERHFEMDRDELLEQMYEVVEQDYHLEDVPIMLNLAEDFVWGIQGKKETTIRFLRSLIMRMSLLYSCDEVKMVFLVEPEDLAEMEFIRYLPHAWDDQHTIRFLAVAASEAYQIGEFISRSLEEDLEKPDDLSEMLKRHPYYVIFATNKRLLDSLEVVKTAISHDQNCSMSVLAAFEDVPKESSVLIQLEEDPEAWHTIVYLKQIDREDDHFRLDTYPADLARRSMHTIANTRLKMVSQAYALPKTLTFLEMYGVGKIEHLNISNRWKENYPISSLAVPVGVGTDGSLSMLDLHQKYQGPHGLVAGTTGSGKSEFLLTYILSLAVNFHPDEVAFVLIDYKGGGLAGAFDDPRNGIHLPHLMATITNLDGAAINRSLVSIQSEVKRRQRVFNEAKSISGEGTMDIYTYQRLYRSKVVSEAMPHLFIISDEFAELKQQEPEFLDALVSIARIGRSLGVHLILATQKPGGVVTDQIATNTKFRVCLKVADRGDSMEMLKRPDAAELRETGRFYLQVGNNELFALGQSAWSGAAYEPKEEVVVKRDESVQVIDRIGGTILEKKPEVKTVNTGRSQLVEIVRYLTDLAQEMHLEQRSLWMPPLSGQIDQEELEREEAGASSGEEPEQITYCAGMLDDPENQKQYLLKLDLNKTGSILVYGEPTSGKTTFIQSLLISLVKRYSPEKLQFYILDYSSRLLRLFRNLPHCGAVLAEEDAGELPSFFKLLREIVDERKKLFTQLEADSYESACRIRPIPMILVIIDNLQGMVSSKQGAKQYDELGAYMKEAAGYGIRYVVSVSHLSEIPPRFRQELPGRVLIRMRDKYEYFELLGALVHFMPADRKGRGVYNYEGRPLEMQLGMFAPDLEGEERVQAVKDLTARLAEKYADCTPARQLRIISETETYDSFVQQFKPGRLPLGYDMAARLAVALPYKQFSMLSLYFGNPVSVLPALNNLIYEAGREKMQLMFLKSISDSCAGELTGLENAKVYGCDLEGLEKLYKDLFALIRERHAIFQKYCADQGLDENKKTIYLDVYHYMREQVTPVMVIIERCTDLFTTSSGQENWNKYFSSIFLLARRYQIFLFGCYYPDEQKLLDGNKLAECFNPEKLVLLFGGAYAKQNLVDSLPYEIARVDKPTAFNRFLMNYQDSIHPLLMPCTDPRTGEVDEDDLPIFAQEG